jgi:hypothetical protein
MKGSFAQAMDFARALWTRWSPRLGLGLVYFLVAAAAFDGFYQKEGFQDHNGYIYVGTILDGTALRPFVYRRLNPEIAQAAATVIPAGVQQKIYTRYIKHGTSGLGPDAAISKGPRYFIVYNALYYVTFAEFLISLFVLRSLFKVFVGRAAATVTPPILALLMPIIQATAAGFYYDYGELLFISAAGLAAVRGRVGQLVGITILGTLNKEAFLFFIPALAPLLRFRFTRGVLPIVALLIAVSAVVCFCLWLRYRGNPGGEGDFKLLQNILFYANPRNLFRFDKPYGVFLPRPYSLFWLSCAAAVILAGWRRADPRVRQHSVIAFAINLPLFLLLCAPGEMRDFGLCLLGFGALMAYAVDAAIARDGQAVAGAPVSRLAGSGRGAA